MAMTRTVRVKLKGKIDIGRLVDFDVAG